MKVLAAALAGVGVVAAHGIPHHHHPAPPVHHHHQPAHHHHHPPPPPPVHHHHVPHHDLHHNAHQNEFILEHLENLDDDLEIRMDHLTQHLYDVQCQVDATGMSPACPAAVDLEDRVEGLHQDITDLDNAQVIHFNHLTDGSTGLLDQLEDEVNEVHLDVVALEAQIDQGFSDLLHGSDNPCLEPQEAEEECLSEPEEDTGIIGLDDVQENLDDVIADIATFESEVGERFEDLLGDPAIPMSGGTLKELNDGLLKLQYDECNDRCGDDVGEDECDGEEHGEPGHGAPLVGCGLDDMTDEIMHRFDDVNSDNEDLQIAIDDFAHNLALSEFDTVEDFDALFAALHAFDHQINHRLDHIKSCACVETAPMPFCPAMPPPMMHFPPPMPHFQPMMMAPMLPMMPIPMQYPMHPPMGHSHPGFHDMSYPDMSPHYGHGDPHQYTGHPYQGDYDGHSDDDHLHDGHPHHGMGGASDYGYPNNGDYYGDHGYHGYSQHDSGYYGY